MIKQLGLLQSPESDLQHYMTTSETVSFDFDHLRDYLDGSTIRITVVLQIPEMRCLMASATADTSSALLACSSLDEAALKLQLPVLDLRAPLPLSPIEVAKPWGREIWFTGIEQRGVCTFDGISIPWLLACFCELLLGSATPPPLLLKILEPRSDEVLGDLYFEAHTEKTEVYVVTEIDPAAWPDGVGKIRFGFNPAKRSQYRNDIEFRNAYLGAVTSYRAIRYEIDRLQQQDSNEQALPPSLIEQEVAARQSMDTFTSLRDLRVGDVVQVPPLTPHSLQHGVTVVEFQTPHYERYILSFGQRVLTQDHWDTEEALAHIDSSTSNPLNRVSNDLIADFDQFQVLRVILHPEESLVRTCDDYAIIMAIIGVTTIGDATLQKLAPGEALFLPAGYKVHLQNLRSDTNTVLIAVPKSATE